ncbi:MAG TPA: methyltransferase domain-containing protein [Candidatus Acidoferrum sp.]|nr:methyltransferase domain-containing protein [Candidatus Acidoferrum sp.]
MAQFVDLYNTSYNNPSEDVYREIRLETYGEDHGQTSWMTLDELDEIPVRLGLDPSSSVLEIGSGAGGCAIHLAATVGCHVTGVDINAGGVRHANELARAQGLESRARFQECDLSRGIPFDINDFDAIYSNDTICHIPNRLGLLLDARRVMKPGGRLLYSDAIVVTGELSKEEMATRSSIGHYVFVKPGENEAFIQNSGFKLLRTDDTTENAAEIAKLWHDARAKREAALTSIEGAANFAGLQKFLLCAHTLAAERRLSRFLYLARK